VYRQNQGTFKSGALTEIVEHRKTGFLVSDVDEMADAIQAAAGLDRDACRKAAVDRFSADRMTRQYIELYQQILSGGRSAGIPPNAAQAHAGFL
jgi:glycosyltransferase involved in cell wall biosynthesis